MTWPWPGPCGMPRAVAARRGQRPGLQAVVKRALARLRAAEECEAFEVSGDRVSKEIVLILTSREQGKMTAADVNYHERNH